MAFLQDTTLQGRTFSPIRFVRTQGPMEAILCLQNEPLHFSEKHQRDEMKLHRHIMKEKFFSKIVSRHSSSQPLRIQFESGRFDQYECDRLD